MAGAEPPSPFARPASNCACPLASVRRVASTSLPREISRTSMPLFGSRRRQRVDEDMDAVVAGERRETEIGDDEPLGRERIVIVVDVFQLLRLRHHDVDAGL